MHPFRRQQGIALITAMLLVALTTALAVNLIWDNQIGLRRTEMGLAQEQARQFALGAEAIAVEALLQDSDTGFDHAGENWAQPVPPLPVGIDDEVLGTLQGQLFDAQGQFNLNNLVQAGSGNTDAPAKEQFVQLLSILQLDPLIADAVIDWIDADTVPQGNGAEDGTYTTLDPPYRAANNFMLDVSELRLVYGVNDEIYQVLLPHVTALPPGWCGSAGRPVPVNISAASAAVIAAMDPANISLGQAEGWVEEREQLAEDYNGWESWTDIVGLPADFPQRLGDYVSLNSNCFELRALVNVGSSVLSMYSLLDRSSLGGQIVTRMRTYGVE